MSQNNPLPNTTPSRDESWKTRLYAIGVMLGALAGFIASYLFARSAEENEDGKPQPIPTSTLLGLVLTGLSLIRQIAESGKPRKK
jgi:H+/Cl- antiporter ClcA